MQWNLEVVEAELERLKAAWGISARVEVANLKGRWGDCRIHRVGGGKPISAIIRLSRYIPDMAEALDTLRHEYAHAVTDWNQRTGHGWDWRVTARQMGATPRACAPRSKRLVGVAKLEPFCPDCNHRYRAVARRNRRYRCRECGGPVEYRRVVT